MSNSYKRYTRQQRREEEQRQRDMVGTSSGAKQRKSFFNVLLGDFKTGLELPKAATKSFGSEESAILTTQNGSWTVSINKTKNGRLQFEGNGWGDFVRDNALTEGDILVFTFVGDALLSVFAFGKTSCLKTPNAKNGPPADKPPAPHFEVIFARFNLLGLFVPEEFVAETNMRSRKMVVVKDWEQREWPVEVTQQSGGILLGDGWAEFVRQNALRIGETCSFQSLVPNADDDVLVLLANPCAVTPL